MAIQNTETRAPAARDLGLARGAKRSGVYEFTGARAELFKQALAEYPNARRDDFMLMRAHLDPRAGDHILGFGEGSGHFCRTIAEAVAPSGRYVITEPSPELFCNIPQDVLDLPHVFTEITAIEDLDAPPESFDKAWACGAFHHSSNQTRAIAQIHRALKKGGKLVLFDIFAGTPMAAHFDSCVARWCETGHEVKFLSNEFARTLCDLAGFAKENVSIVDIPHRLSFDTEWDMGNFIFKIHAMTRMPGSAEERIEKTIASLKTHLPVEREDGKVVLHFDQRGLIAIK
jgi:SAM-dependent methyltransferase